MKDLYQFIFNLDHDPNYYGPVVVGFLTILTTGLALFSLRSKEFRYALKSVLNTFFTVTLYKEIPKYPHRSELNVMRLERELRDLRATIEKGISPSTIKAVERVVDSYASARLSERIDHILQKESSPENQLLKHLEEKVEKTTREFLREQGQTGITALLQTRFNQELHLKASTTLDQVVEAQMRNASALRSIMINLFILFNVGIISMYVFAGSKIQPQTSYGIVGLYVSMAMFIVFIYKASNVRSSVLLAINEDQKHFYGIWDYLKTFCAGRTLTDHDVEIIRLLATNRSEREKSSEHPYELIFKGLSNSTVAFKGAKISVGGIDSKKDKDKS